MKVWRVAHESLTCDGFPSGPYITRGLPAELADTVNDMLWAHSDNAHPAPHQDPLLIHIRGLERCGFDSLESLYTWFKGYERLLHECGFRIYVYEVPAGCVRIGCYGQALFLQSAAQEIEVSELAVEIQV